MFLTVLDNSKTGSYAKHQKKATFLPTTHVTMTLTRSPRVRHPGPGLQLLQASSKPYGLKMWALELDVLEAKFGVDG